jgi:hypothetical protein
MRTILRLTLMSLASFAVTFSQPAFEVLLRATDGVVAETLYFGFFPGAHFCPGITDCLNGHCEEFLPLPPLPGAFDARLVGWNYWSIPCYDQGVRIEFRPSPPVWPTGRDTLRVLAQIGTGTSMIFSWPPGPSAYFTQLTMKYFDEVLLQNVCIDMLQDTIANITDPGDPVYLTIFSGRLATSAVPEPSGTPDRFELLQNYPNPFNPVTSIAYHLPRDMQVELQVVDPLGRVVATPVNGMQRAGTRMATFDGSRCSSGLYFCRLKTGNAVQCGKMLLLK